MSRTLYKGVLFCHETHASTVAKPKGWAKRVHYLCGLTVRVRGLSPCDCTRRADAIHAEKCLFRRRLVLIDPAGNFRVDEPEG